MKAFGIVLLRGLAIGTFLTFVSLVLTSLIILTHEAFGRPAIAVFIVCCFVGVVLSVIHHTK